MQCRQFFWLCYYLPSFVFLQGVAGLRFAIVPKTTDNPFFVAAHEGCIDALQWIEGGRQEKDSINDSSSNNKASTCVFGGIAATAENPNPDPTGAEQAAYVQGLLQSVQNGTEQFDGMAISVKNVSLMTPIIDEILAAGIPVVTYDSDAPESGRRAYIGTDNSFLGDTLAKVAQQLRPLGGTFAILWGDASPNVALRDEGFRKAIFKTNENDEDDDGDLWSEMPGSPVNYNRDLDYALELMADFAQRNCTVTVTTTGGPLFHSNYPQFYKRYRKQGITIISVDDFAIQIEYLSRGYVHGLVGQKPYEMGYYAALELEKIKREGWSGRVNVLGTNLITHIEVPLVLPELVVDKNLIDTLRIIGYTLLALILAMSLFCGIWTWWNKNEAVVRAAQPIFLILVAFGVAILGATIIPLSMDDNGDESIENSRATWICMMVPWLASCGFTITFSALVSKTIRINRIIQETRQCHRVQVKTIDVLGPFSVVLTLNVVVLTLWSAIDPLVYKRIDNEGTDGWNRVISSYGACRCDKPLAYAAPLAIINLCVLILAIWQAYKAREIRLEFAESKYIAICLISLLEALLIGIPILMVVRDSPQAYYLTIIFIVFVICMGVLFLIFVPKMLMSEEYSHRSLAEQRRIMNERIHESIPVAPRGPGRPTSSP